MGLDFNKIVMESIQDTVDSNDTKEIKITKKEQNISNHLSENTLVESLNPAITAALSAGLGALTLRNKIHRVNEGIEDFADKIGSMASGAGKVIKKFAGTAAEKIGDNAENIKKYGMKYGGKFIKKVGVPGAIATAAAPIGAGVAAGYALSKRRPEGQ